LLLFRLNLIQYKIYLVVPTRIHVALPHFLLRAGIRYITEQDSRFDIVKESEHFGETKRHLKQTPGDLLICDYQAEGWNGPQGIRTLLDDYSDLKVLVISDDNDPDNVMKMIDWKVPGFLTPHCDRAEMVNALLAAAKGERFYCNKVLQLLLDRSMGIEPVETCEKSILTTRELEIVKLIAEGNSGPEIGRLIHLSPHTVYTHRKNIMKKLKIQGTSELIRFAISEGLFK